MKTLLLLIIVIAIGAFAYKSFTQEQRDEAITRVAKAGRALNGEVRPDDVEHKTPNIVEEQQRKERIRQNTTWTSENQALHPIEYCQAKLEDITEYANRLETSMHEMSVSKSAASREITDNETMLNTLSKFIDDAKKSYKNSSAGGNDHVMLNGFSIPLEKAREKMVEANRKIPYLKERIATRKNMIAHLEKNMDKISAEQKRLVGTKERIQNTINDLRLKKVIEGNQSIRDALNAINDSIASLGVDYDAPSLSDLTQPSKSATIDAEFEKMMAE